VFIYLIFGRINEPKKTGARSARARTRGQNPLVLLKYLSGTEQGMGLKILLEFRKDSNMKNAIYAAF
jgi:hypothetical protein